MKNTHDNHLLEEAKVKKNSNARRISQNTIKRIFLKAGIAVVFIGSATFSAVLLVRDRELLKENKELLAENELLNKLLTNKDVLLKDKEKLLRGLASRALLCGCSEAGRIMYSFRREKSLVCSE